MSRIFRFLKKALPVPNDDPESFFAQPRYIVWAPVKRSDVAWNFEKFLIGPDGTPAKRYSKAFETIKIKKDIEDLLKAQGSKE